MTQYDDESDATRELIARVWPLLEDDATAEDMDATRLLLLDHIAVAGWGMHLPVGVAMARHASTDLAAKGPELPMIGTHRWTSALAAAMANSVASAAYEFDDSHRGASVHPGAVVFPAAMAATRLAGADASSFFGAVLVGYEVMCRVGRAVDPQAHRARHFHPTATTGHFGAAAAAAAALGLDADTAVAALSLAGTVAGGSMQFLEEGAETKQLHPALAVQRGVQAAQLAGRGFPGLRDLIGGRRGFLAAQSAQPRVERLLEGFEDRPSELRQTGIKPYPTCRNAQSPLDALFAIVSQHGVTADSIEAVRFGLVRPGIQTVWEPVDVRRRPASLVDAQFSLPYVAAVALLDGEVTPRQFTPARLGDPVTLALADRVTCEHDPDLDSDYPESWPAWARVTTTDGRVLEARVDHPRGDPENPLAWDDVVDKLRSIATEPLGRDRVDGVAENVARLPADGSLDDLLALF